MEQDDKKDLLLLKTPLNLLGLYGFYEFPYVRGLLKINNPHMLSGIMFKMIGDNYSNNAVTQCDISKDVCSVGIQCDISKDVCSVGIQCDISKDVCSVGIQCDIIQEKLDIIPGELGNDWFVVIDNNI